MGYTTNCLIDYIGLLGCSTTVPLSGLYVNGLQGISLKSVDRTANEEQVTFAGVWSDVQLRATRRIFTAIRAEFNKRAKLKNTSQIVNLGERIDTASTTALAAKYRGFTIDLDNFDINDHYIVSNYQQINVQYLRLYLPSALNTTIKIFDLISGAQLFTSALVGAAGWNTIQVNQKFTTRKAFVAYDATLITGAQLEVLSDYCGGGHCEGTVYGGESPLTSTVFNSAITRGQNTFGLSGSWDIQCTYDSLVCNNKEAFTNALWYLLGAELLAELQYSSRLNFYTTINAAKAIELRAEFETIYKDELMNAIDGMSLSLSDCCLECNDQVIIYENLP